MASAGGSGSLASLFVEFTTKGLDLVNNQIAALGKALGPLGTQLTLANTAMIGFVGSASPVAINTFTGSLQILSASIGQAFVPVLMEASFAIQDLASWFENLSEEQVAHITKWGEIIAVAGAGFLIFNRFAPVLSLVLSGVKLLTTSLGLLSAAGASLLIPLTLIAGIVLAIGGAANKAGGGMGGLMEVFGQLGENLKGFFETLRPIFEPLKNLFATLAPLFQEVGRLLGTLFDALSPLLEIFGTVLTKIGEIIIPVLSAMIEALTWVLQRLNDIIESFKKPAIQAKKGETQEEMEKRILEGLGPLANNPLAREAARRQAQEAVRDRDEEQQKAKAKEDNKRRQAAVVPAKEKTPRAPHHLIARNRTMQATIGSVADAWKRIQLASLNMDDIQRKMFDLQQKGDQRAQATHQAVLDILDSVRGGLLF